MNKYDIRKFEQKDFNELVGLMRQLQIYFGEIDIEKIIDCRSDFGQLETTQYLQDIEKMNGICLVAEKNNEIVGFIQGIIQINNSEGYLRSHKNITKDGWIGLLFVIDSERSSGLGKSLIDKIEEYFKKQGCEFVRIKVSAYNKIARKFYENRGYYERDIELRKSLKS